MQREDGRAPDQMRPVEAVVQVSKWAEGSCQIAFGDTEVLCLASIEEYVPRWRKDSGLGWVTAEYDMLPRSTGERRQRSSRSGKADSRALEISRLIGRSLRSVVDFAALGPRTITIDCDVIQADGGTRTAAICGGYLAMVDAMRWLVDKKRIPRPAVKESVVAVSVGVLGTEPILDLCYQEDSRAAVDMNVVMTGHGRLIEVQGTGEERPFSRDVLNKLLDLAEIGAGVLTRVQEQALADVER